MIKSEQIIKENKKRWNEEHDSYCWHTNSQIKWMQTLLQEFVFLTKALKCDRGNDVNKNAQSRYKEHQWKYHNMYINKDH
jgi:hypothetical protein